MIRSGLIKLLCKFRRREDGNATIEFVILAPLLLLMLVSTVELGMINLRQSQLERALDITVRGIRLSTGSAPQHNEIRDQVCDLSGFIDDCATSLRLEMVQLDPFAWSPVDPEPDCVNSIEDVQPVRTFVGGASNELMLIRACMKYRPFISTWGLGDVLEKDGDGRASLFAASAFVQEPR
ncbi:hypothetical protein RSK20926_02634 [Roseobacter sp. SK209-2-6]|uniref:TadE/TadG family type IV pilus assembly protein n=1 Tax=Roseobacter sp. SK209-2-6 TaxID=388739 RepID=UPI0000F3EDBD|nr:TadE/TadG family type IV pilus assembly protein [Roseobacter sp. SK209-2-6]EBA16665.1 hypothetical protein RSK20926_02634 [Roseobacter sp. SK209-2-6]